MNNKNILLTLFCVSELPATLPLVVDAERVNQPEVRQDYSMSFAQRHLHNINNSYATSCRNVFLIFCEIF